MTNGRLSIGGMNNACEERRSVQVSSRCKVPTKKSVTRAYAAQSHDLPLAPFEIERREVRDRDVHIEILYCGVCHSDIHMARNEWGSTIYPVVPGHEIVGRVTARRGTVKRFKVGDLGRRRMHGRFMPGRATSAAKATGAILRSAAMSQTYNGRDRVTATSPTAATRPRWWSTRTSR